MPAHAVYELRNYIMQPSQRDVMIALFEREFIESQEVLGARVVGTFRNLDAPNRFVWIRSFENMTTRADALNGFYSGPIWQTHRAAANATIVDSDDVLLLRPISCDAAYRTSTRPETGAPPLETFIQAETYFLADRQDEAFARRFAAEALPILRDAGRAPFATFATEHAQNSYPRLPVRENETVFVTLTHFASAEAHATSTKQAAAALYDVAASLRPYIIAPSQTLRLRPTARSLLR